MLGTTEAARAFSTLHPGAIYLHLGRSYHVARARPRDPPGARGAVRRRLVHPAQARDRHADRAAARPPRGARRAALVRRACWSPRPCSPTSAAGSPTTARSTSPRSSCPPTRFATQAMWFELDADAARRLPAGAAARLAARGRARADRRAAAARDVRPLGHRRPLDQRPPPDRRPDDLHPRRSPRRRRHHADRLRPVREARRATPTA